MLIVQKYGGTSLDDAQKIRSAAKRAVMLAADGNHIVMVVSARGHTTDRLLEDAAQLAHALAGREMDMCLAAGEQTSAGLMAMAIREMGADAVSLTGWQAGILTDDEFGNARILELTNDRILRELERGKIVVVAGFQGVTEDGEITTLGRGGSDTTAVALAAFLQADQCQIYTDVDGVYDRDPHKFPNAVRYERIGYDQMLCLARQGAQVLHDRCVELAQRYRVKIRVLSSLQPGEGTLVCDTQE